MKKKTLLIILTALMMQLFAVTSANPTLPAYPDVPDLNPPLITLELNSVLDYMITVEKPASWFGNGTIYGSLRSVGYVIDGTRNVTVADSETGKLPEFLPETRTATFRGTFRGSSLGENTIQVWAKSVSMYHPLDTPQNFYGWWAVGAEYPVEAQSAILHFSIAADETPEGQMSSTTLTVILATALALVGVVVLVFFKRRKTSNDVKTS